MEWFFFSHISLVKLPYWFFSRARVMYFPWCQANFIWMDSHSYLKHTPLFCISFCQWPERDWLFTPLLREKKLEGGRLSLPAVRHDGKSQSWREMLIASPITYVHAVRPTRLTSPQPDGIYSPPRPQARHNRGSPWSSDQLPLEQILLYNLFFTTCHLCGVSERSCDVHW